MKLPRHALIALCALLVATGCSDDNNTNPIDRPAPSPGGDSGGMSEPTDMDMGVIADMPDGGMMADSDSSAMEMGPDMCVPLSDEELCQQYSFGCGSLNITTDVADNCGEPIEIESCGVCMRPQLCEESLNAMDQVTATSCGCSVENTDEICDAEGKLCGAIDPPCEQIICDTFCVDSVASGDTFNCAVGSGNVRCWGSNRDGQLGLGDTQGRENPTQLMTLPIDVVEIANGGRHTCALLVDTSVICWGGNAKGQLGVRTTVDATKPDLTKPQARAFPEGTGVAKVVAGDRHTCALVDTDYDASTPGTPPAPPYAAYCWGSNEFGIVGNDDIQINVVQGSPQLVDGLLDNVYDIAAGDQHTCAIVDAEDPNDPKARHVRCWGADNAGQIGVMAVHIAKDANYYYGDAYQQGFDYIFHNVPRTVQDPSHLPSYSNPNASPAAQTGMPFTSRFKEVAVGRTFSCVRDDNLEVWCWGAMPFDHMRGTCEEPNMEDEPPQCTIWPPSNDTWSDLLPNRVQPTPPVYTIVNHRRNQDGDPDYETSGDKAGLPRGDVEYIASALRPVRIKYLEDPLKIPSMASPGANAQATQIAAHNEHLCMIVPESMTTKTNIYCMGHNALGEVGVGSDNPTKYATPIEGDVNGNIVRGVDIELGDRHTCAVAENNNIKCWGSNAADQLGNENIERDNSFIPQDVLLR